MVDFAAILPILAAARPDLNLSIENPNGRGGIGITEVYDPAWNAAHPDLTVAEFAAWTRLSKRFDGRGARRGAGSEVPEGSSGVVGPGVDELLPFAPEPA